MQKGKYERDREKEMAEHKKIKNRNNSAWKAKVTRLTGCSRNGTGRRIRKLRSGLLFC